MDKCDHNDITATPFKGVTIQKCNDCGATRTVDGAKEVSAWYRYVPEYNMLTCIKPDGRMINCFIEGDIGTWAAQHNHLGWVVVNCWPITKEAYDLHKERNQ